MFRAYRLVSTLEVSTTMDFLARALRIERALRDAKSKRDKKR
jgi:hypothetical protein